MVQRSRREQNRGECYLPPFKIEKVLTASQAGEHPGWQITAFDLPQAWQHSDGEGVTIAVLDTGADLKHPDLKENLVVPKGANFVNPRKPPVDDNGHGSHVSGIICAPKNDLGIIGVAPKAKVMPLKVLDQYGNGDMVDVAKAIRFAVDRKVDAISMSLGATFKLQNVRKAIQHAAKKHIPVFCAAGNAAAKKMDFPARYPETIAIGSIDKDFKRSDFSNKGKNLDFMAPGGRILSTIPDGQFGIMSGTSMACPFAVAVTALLISYIKNNDTGIVLETIDDYRSVLKEHTIPISNQDIAGRKFWQGFGIIWPKAFIEAIQNQS
jgi:major intracellular serine protease